MENELWVSGVMIELVDATMVDSFVDGCKKEVEEEEEIWAARVLIVHPHWS